MACQHSVRKLSTFAISIVFNQQPSWWTFNDHVNLILNPFWPATYLYEDIFTPNVHKVRLFWTTYPPFLIHVVIERPLEPCRRPDEKWSSVKASGNRHAAFFSSDLLIFLCTVPYEPDKFWQKKHNYLTCMSLWTIFGRIALFWNHSRQVKYVFFVKTCLVHTVQYREI